MNHVVIWEFHVNPEFISDFENIYGPDGGWSQLFRLSADYLGTKLLRDVTHPGRYLTLDCWTSHDALQRFKQEHRDAYDALDRKCESLTEREVFLGDFDAA